METKKLYYTDPFMTAFSAAVIACEAVKGGYAVVLADGKAVTSVDQTQEYMTLVMLDGRVDVKTLNARKENPFGEEAANL